MRHVALLSRAEAPEVPLETPGRIILPGHRTGAAPSRYGDRPTDWRTRLVGIGGTSAVCLSILGAMLFTWQFARSTAQPPRPLAVQLMPLAAPPEPMQDVPDGPQQIEQVEQKQQDREDRPDLREILIPRPSPMAEPAPPKQQAQAAEPVAETSAPRSLPALPARQASSNAEASWEAQLLAHLERYRRYPAAARARREQGVAHVRFRMTREGRLIASEVARSSGSVALDRAALDTLRRAQPLPAVPESRPAPLELIVPVEFFVRR